MTRCPFHQRRSNKVGTVTVGTVNGAQPSVGVRRRADVVFQDQTKFGIGIIAWTPCVDPLTHDSCRFGLDTDFVTNIIIY